MIPSLLLAAAAPLIGVLELRDKVPEGQRLDTAYLSDQVRSAVKETLPQAPVITRENMLVLLQASGKKLEECEGECEVETGRRIGADLVISGELLRLGSDRRQAAGEAAPRERHLLPNLAAAVWLTAGYDWTSNTVALADRPKSAFGLDLGAHLFYRIAGPVYLGGLIDYALSGPDALLVAGGVRLVTGAVALSTGLGYTSLASGGLGALAAVELGVASGFALRVQGSWRRASEITAGVTPVEETTTVWSLMGGLSLQL